MIDLVELLKTADFTEYGDLLATLQPGPSEEGARRMVAMMLSLKGPEELANRWYVNEWVPEYTLYEAVVNYNGLNKPEEFGTPDTFKYALGVELSPKVQPTGQIYLLWNDPYPIPEPEPEPPRVPDPLEETMPYFPTLPESER